MHHDYLGLTQANDHTLKLPHYIFLMFKGKFLNN